MRDVQDLMSGIHYLEMTSRPKQKPVKKDSTIMEGLGIVGGFVLCMLAIVIAM